MATVQVEGLDEAVLRLRALSERAGDLQPFFRGRLDKHVTTVFRRQFESEGAFGGQKWAPLAPATVRQKERLGRSGMPILQRFRDLWASLAKTSSAPQAFLRITPDSYERGTTVPYAAHHQKGHGDLPVRQIVPSPMPDSVVRTWSRLLGQYVAEGRT